MKHLSHVIFTFLFVCLCVPSFGQDALARIRSIEYNAQYYKGKGMASTLEEATRIAEEALARSISTTISSQDESKSRAVNGQVNEIVQSNVKISSYISNLQNIHKIVAEEGRGKKHQYIVLTYVAVDDVNAMFQEQADIIIGYIEQAQKKEYTKEIGYAISDYYKAFVLLNTSPIANSLEYTGYDGVSQNAKIYITHQIENLLQGITVEAMKVNPADNSITLGFKYQNTLISGHLLFDYYDATLYENFENRQANNGCCVLNFNAIPEQIDITIAYHDTYNVHDNMLKNAMEMNGKTPFRNAKKEVMVSKAVVKKRETKKQEAARFEAQVAQDKIYTNHIAKFTDADKKELKTVLLDIEKAIASKQYAAVKPHFTSEGYDRWQALVHRGKAKLVEQPNYTFLTLDGTVYCRGMKLQFEFQDNFRPIVEDVCFRFDTNHKIYSLSFCLSTSAEHDITTDRKHWSDTAKITLLSFLEDYKTAYALKDTTYLEKIFSDDALIITGTVVKTQKNRTADAYSFSGFGTQDPTVNYKIKSKKEFIADLKRNFKQKRWVNIMFEDVDVKRRVRDDSDLYGIQVRQNYFSNNYCDEGYLSLLVDLKDDIPVIYVRVWQEEKVAEFSAETIANNPGMALELGK